MKVNWFRVAIIGAAIAAASFVIVYAIQGKIETDTLRTLNDTQDMQFANMLQMQQNVAEELNTLSQQRDLLNNKLNSIGRVTNHSLDVIAQMREELKKRHDEIGAMSDDELNRFILDGLARYQREQRTTGERPHQ